MITRTDIVEAVLQGKQAIDNPNTEINQLRFLVNKMTYQLSHGLLAGNVEADRLTIGYIH